MSIFTFTTYEVSSALGSQPRNLELSPCVSYIPGALDYRFFILFFDDNLYVFRVTGEMDKVNFRLMDAFSIWTYHLCQYKITILFQRNKKTNLIEVCMTRALGTSIWVTLHDTCHLGRGALNFYRHKSKESHKSNTLINVIGRGIRLAHATAKWENLYIRLQVLYHSQASGLVEVRGLLIFVIYSKKFA